MFTGYVSFQPGPRPGVNGLDHHVDDAERQKTEPMDTVFVRQVAPSGPADRAGLSTGENYVYCPTSHKLTPLEPSMDLHLWEMST